MLSLCKPFQSGRAKPKILHKMSTRNLTMVISGGQTKIAQYGQWDGHPESTGATVLEFARKCANSEFLQKFKTRLESARFTTDADQKLRDEFLESIGAKDGWVDDAQSQQYRAKFPLDSRDHGADILELVAASEGEVILRDRSEFGRDSLYCEYAYVIDLDAQTFEAYEGFQKVAGEPSSRFYTDTADRSGYFGCRLVSLWPIGALPSDEDFINAFASDDDDE